MVAFKYGYNPIELDDLHAAPRRSGADFSSQEYWDNRFSNDDATFDWLVPAQVLSDFTVQFLGPEFVEDAEILHIGCGTSRSIALRDLVPDPQQIHNVDFSEKAILTGSMREQEMLARNKAPATETRGRRRRRKHDSVQGASSPPFMLWSCLDLRSLNDVFGLLHAQAETGRLFDLILDKATSDSISCGPSVRVQLPYQLQRWARGNTGHTQAADIHPMNVLAVHLAALTTPKTGQWVVISNSMDRLPFIPPYARSLADGFLSRDVVADGFPDPKSLWVLERKEEIEITRHESLAQLKARLQSGRQPPNPFLYVLRRTAAAVTD